MIYVNDNIACKELRKNDLSNVIEGIFIEISIRKNKWLIFGGYNPHKRNIRYFLDNIGKSLDKFITIYDNILLLGDFNSEISDNHINEFLESFFQKLPPTIITYRNYTKFNNESFCNELRNKLENLDFFKMTLIMTLLNQLSLSV